MTGILISVRNPHEAQTILAAVAELAILDIKEPAQGALGAAAPEIWQAIERLDLGHADLSIALGELADIDLCTLPNIPPSTRYAKIGLANQNQRNWLEAWKMIQTRLPSRTELVGVIYADYQQAGSPSPQQVIDRLLPQPCRTFLIDTFDKSNGHLLDHLPRHALLAIRDRIRQQDGALVLAGSINTEILPDILAIEPDCIGVRGAVCSAGRENMVCPQAATSFVLSLTLLTAGI